MKKQAPDEFEILKELSQGAEPAFRYIYETYGKRLYYFVRSLKLPPEDAEEIVQETFVRLWENRSQTRPDGAIQAYIMTIARNLVYNHMQREAIRQRYSKEMMKNANSVSHIHDGELRQLIEKELTEMPERRQRVFRMSRFEGYSNQRIAEELSISKSTVENHLNKALNHLRKLLERYGYPLIFLLIIRSIENTL